MTIANILKIAQKQISGQQAVVVLPLNVWEDVEDKLENYDIMHASKLKKDIAISRKQVAAGKVVSLNDL